MSGIAGIFGSAPTAGRDVTQMLSCVRHEPWYTSGTVSEPGVGCHVAWANQRGSFSDAMPLWNATRDVCIVFAGEEFSDVDAAGDAHYLVAMYEKHGPSFVARLNGWFCGVVLDLRKRIAILFNDRYGVKRIYWRQTDQGLYFASEAKALLRIFPDSRSLDADAVAQTFSFGCVLQNRTLFPGLSLLPPAASWTFAAAARLEKHSYFTPAEWEQQDVLAPSDFYQEFRESFLQLLPRYFRGPGQVAMSLTGGLDGRMIMAWARRPPGALPCYSFGSSYRDCRDVRLARRIAQVCRQPHTTIEAGKEFIAQFATLAPRSVYLSDGTMDVSGAVELYVNHMAREIAPTRLTGNYGSEIVRANVAFRPRDLTPRMFEPEFFGRIEQAADTYQAERQGHDLSFIAFKQVPWHHHARLSVEQSQLTLRSPFLDNDLVGLMYRAPKAVLAGKDLSLRLIHDGDPALAAIPTDRGVAFGPATISSRVRNLVQEFTVRAEYAYDYGMPQWLAKVDNAIAPLGLERLFLGRHKFYHFRTWYRHALAPYVKEVLLDRRSLERSYFRPGVLEGLVENHTSGRANYTLEIHRALTLELTHRELLDRWPGESR